VRFAEVEIMRRQEDWAATEGERGGEPVGAVAASGNFPSTWSNKKSEVLKTSDF
jgi:hypothetical protein